MVHYKHEKNNRPGIGIDFGTKFTSVGTYQNRTFTILKNEFGNSRTPSIVSFDTNGVFTVGESAQIQSKFNPKGNTIYHPKNFIGKE
jgi:molecular chaperone DnaK (HSP70)